MSVHCSLEMLSTYVDAELAESERRNVEAHVRECEECRDRLSHLEGVVGQLKRLKFPLRKSLLLILMNGVFKN